MKHSPNSAPVQLSFILTRILSHIRISVSTICLAEKSAVSLCLPHNQNTVSFRIFQLNTSNTSLCNIATTGTVGDRCFIPILPVGFIDRTLTTAAISVMPIIIIGLPGSGCMQVNMCALPDSPEWWLFVLSRFMKKALQLAVLVSIAAAQTYRNIFRKGMRSQISATAPLRRRPLSVVPAFPIPLSD